MGCGMNIIISRYSEPGSTASHPAYNYNNRNEFVIDCACYPGSSGSQVMLYNFRKEGREEF